jgi:hypothetical protein
MNMSVTGVNKLVARVLFGMRSEILRAALPKFNDFEDRFNGIGITIHDIYFQRIVMLNFRRYQIGWEADILFEAQDHLAWAEKILLKNYTKASGFFGYGCSSAIQLLFI